MRRLIVSWVAVFFWIASASAQSLPPPQIGGQYTGGCAASRPLPLDATAISWTAAGGVCSLTTKWLNGKPLFDIIVGGNTYTIKSINGFPDVRRLAGLLGVSPTFGMAGAPISTLYDQSGNSNNFTQSTSANRPAVWLINGVVSIAFDGFLVDFGSGSNADKFLNFASIATNNRNTTAYAAIQASNGGATFGYSTSDFPTLFNTGTSISHGFALDSGPATAGTQVTWTAYSWSTLAASTPTLWPETQPAVIGVIAGSGGLTVTQNEESASSAALSADTATGGYLGAVPLVSLNGGFYGRMYSFMIAGATTATSGQQTTMRNALYALHGIAKTQKYAILVDGASLDSGVGSLIAGINGYGYVEQMLTQIHAPVRMGNTGVQGATIANITGTVSASQCKFFSASYTNILIGPSSAAGNSISGGETGAQAYVDLQSYLTAIKACSVVPSTIYVWLLGTGCTECVNYNNLVIAGAASLGITPIGGSGYLNSVMATFTTANTQYFNQSPAWMVGHPNVVGYQNFSLAPLGAIRSFGLPFLLKRDLDPAANDNSPMWLNEAA